MIRVQIAGPRCPLGLSRQRVRWAVRAVLQEEGITCAEISVAIVDDPTIRTLNHRYLGHDEPTDVLAFLLDRRDNRLEGEIVASADTARRVAARYQLSPADELLLYVIHGALHLAGWRDDTQRRRAAMQSRQHQWLAKLASR